MMTNRPIRPQAFCSSGRLLPRAWACIGNEDHCAKVSIATVCLAYLLHLDLDLPIQEIKETFPLTQYSARYWMINATVAEGEDKTVQGLIKGPTKRATVFTAPISHGLRNQI